MTREEFDQALSDYYEMLIKDMIRKEIASMFGPHAAGMTMVTTQNTKPFAINKKKQNKKKK